MYAALYHDGAFYLFGGRSYSNRFSQTIARLDTRTTQWSKGGCHKNFEKKALRSPFLDFLLEFILFSHQKAGTLNYGRYGHGAIFDGEKFLIIGGIKDVAGAIKNEVCTLEGSTMTCFEQRTALEGYFYYPELFLVADDFGKEVKKC